MLNGTKARLLISLGFFSYQNIKRKSITTFKYLSESLRPYHSFVLVSRFQGQELVAKKFFGLLKEDPEMQGADDIQFEAVCYLNLT